MLKSARESSISSTAQDSADLVSEREKKERRGHRTIERKAKESKRSREIKYGTETRCLYFSEENVIFLAL